MDEVLGLPSELIVMMVIIVITLAIVALVQIYTKNVTGVQGSNPLSLTGLKSGSMTCQYYDNRFLPWVTNKHYKYTITLKGYKISGFEKNIKVFPVLFYKDVVAGDMAVSQGIEVGPDKENTFTSTFQIETTEIYRGTVGNVPPQEFLSISFFEYREDCNNEAKRVPNEKRPFFMSRCGKYFINTVQVNISSPAGCQISTTADLGVCYYNSKDICLASKPTPPSTSYCFWNTRGDECNYCSILTNPDPMDPASPPKRTFKSCSDLNYYECKCGKEVISGSQGCYWAIKGFTYYEAPETDYECMNCSDDIPCEVFDRDWCIINPCNLNNGLGCYYNSTSDNYRKCQDCPGNFTCDSYTGEGMDLCIVGACGKRCQWNEADHKCRNA